jgi:hypothetical protein
MKYVLLALCLLTCGPAPALDFVYLEFDRGGLRSIHDLPMFLASPQGFKAAGPVNHQPKFGDLQFNVSLAAFVGEDQFVLVHAEVLRDHSGRIDYGALPEVEVSGIKFRTRVQCAELTPEIVSDEHDLRFLADAGFSLLPATYLKQFLLISEDRNTEYILSIGQQVADCSNATISQAWKAELDQQIQNLVSLTRS